SYASVILASVSLLHLPRIVDQAIESRRALALALLAQQFFLRRLATAGISGHIAALYQRKVFGHNEYRNYISDQMSQVCHYESTRHEVLLDPSGAAGPDKKSAATPFCLRFPQTVPPDYAAIYRSKAMLVIRLLGCKLGEEIINEIVAQIVNEIVAQIVNEIVAQIANEIVVQIVDEIVVQIIDEIFAQIIDKIVARIVDEIVAQIVAHITEIVTRNCRSDLSLRLSLELSLRFVAQIVTKLSSDVAQIVTRIVAQIVASDYWSLELSLRLSLRLSLELSLRLSSLDLSARIVAQMSLRIVAQIVARIVACLRIVARYCPLELSLELYSDFAQIVARIVLLNCSLKLSLEIVTRIVAQIVRLRLSLELSPPRLSLDLSFRLSLELSLRLSLEFSLQILRSHTIQFGSSSRCSPAQSRAGGRPFLLSSQALLDLILALTGKNMQYLLDQWVTQPATLASGPASQLIRSATPHRTEHSRRPASCGICGGGGGGGRRRRYTGAVAVSLQELDGPFTHTLKLDESAAVSDAASSRKVLLSNGDELEDPDLGKLESDCSLLWLRVDPEMPAYPTRGKLWQPEPMWHLLLRYERCVASQMARLQGPLPALFSQPGDLAGADGETSGQYYRVRMQACYALCMISGPLDLLEPLMAVFLSLFEVPLCMSLLHTAQGVCPPEVPEFILNLLRPAATVTTENFLAKLPKPIAALLEEVMRHMNLEKLMPSYRIGGDCEMPPRVPQAAAHRLHPAGYRHIQSYAAPGNYIDVRLAAMEAVVNHIKCAKDALRWPGCWTLQKRGQLDTPELVERLWRLLNTELSADCRLRCSVASLYHLLYGRHRPKCTPLPENFLVLNVREGRTKKIAQRAPTPPPAPADTDDDNANFGLTGAGVGLGSSGDEADPLGAAPRAVLSRIPLRRDAAQCLLCLLSLLLNSLSYLALGRDGSDSTLAMQLRSLAVTDVIYVLANTIDNFCHTLETLPAPGWGLPPIRWPLRANLWFSRRRTRNWMGAIWIVAMATSLVRGLEVTSVLADCPDGFNRMAVVASRIFPAYTMAVNFGLQTVTPRDAAGGGSSPNSTIAVSTVSMASSGGAGQLAASSSDKPAAQKQEKQFRQLTRMVTLLMYMYLICQTPMVLYGFVVSFKIPTNLYIIMTLVGNVISSMDGTCNFFIYVVTNPKFKREVRQILGLATMNATGKVGQSGISMEAVGVAKQQQQQNRL
uniref:G_PROTEIN_RECEP_F1_2 domain-containing protein n=1 Tax=Macrostomum lignano TaxID=282301 RepID=A0A1I8FNC5_9PLAT